MKIALYTTSILEFGGGLEKYFIETANNLSRFDDCQVDVVTLDDKFTAKLAKLLSFYYFKKITKAYLYKENLKIIKKNLGEAKYFKCKNFKGLKKKLNEYDVIYSKNEILEASIFKFFLKYKNLPPIIFGVHTPHFYPKTVNLPSKIHNLIYGSKIYNFLTSGAAAFHVINSSDEEKLKKQLGKKFVKKIYNPFDFNQFEKNADNHKFNFMLEGSKFNIIWLGRLSEQKGVADLVKIINELNPKLGDKVVWNIVGDGAEKNKIIKLKEEWQNVNYFGHIEHKYIPNLIARNNLFILTSKWEGFPYTLIEAQTMNLPVISYDIPGPRDIIKNKVNGFLVENRQDFEKMIIDFVEGKAKLEIKDFKSYLSKKFNPRLIYNDLLKLFKDVKAN